MTAGDDIQQAIDTLEWLKAESTPGEWWATRDLKFPDVFAGPGLSDDVCVVSEARLPQDATLIVTLHRTIDAQLKILAAGRTASTAFPAVKKDGDLPGWAAEAKTLALPLARAINGGSA